MDKLQTINKSINEIREILGAECASIEQLPELVKAYVKDDSRNGFTTAFVFSSDLRPARPTGGSLDTTTGLVVGLDGNWSQTGISNTKTRSIETTKMWMSFNIFDPSGNPILEEWTEPVNLKGDKGATGEQGEVGANGPMGPKGETGHSVSFRTVSVYTDTETLDTPSNPIGGFWNFTTNEVTPPTSETGITWHLNADIPNRKKYLWLSQATFDESGSILNNWCQPFRLTGEDGQDGVDGQVTEFIYRRLPNMKAYDALKLYLKDNKLESKNESEFIPETEDHIGGTEWSDSPTGITEALPIEVCCTRVRKSINDPWGPWSNCIIWAKWGEDGMDGDGVEYIYLVTEPRVNGEKITSEIIANPQFGYMPSRYEATLRADYQDDEFCFNETWGYEGYEWTDEPSDVGPDQPLEWVSIRKKKNGVWGEFSDPQLWATFSEDGAAYLTSFVFTRATINTPPQRPAGGNIDNPMPILTPEWKDSVPMEFSDLPVWISKRTFKSGDDNWDDWNEPKILSDSPDFQVEYCAKQQRPSALTPFTGDEIAWRREQADVWGDDDTIVDPVWMATTIKKGGIWSPWVVTQIKGEKGDKGENGTSVSMKGKVATKQELLDAWDSYVNGGPFLSFNVDLIAGESIFVEEDGHLYIYSGGFYPGEDDVTFEKYWTSVLIQGEPGKNAYLYLAYTDELNPDVDIWIDPGHVAKYIGMFYSDEVYSNEALLDYNLYTWTKWSGEDGWGYEQIFLLTHKDLPYHPNGYHCPLPVKEEGDNTPGYLPHHPFANGAKPFEPETRWSDTPLSPDEEYPFCWVATRKVNGTEYSEWKGDTNKTASLYSRYTVDGVSGVYIELSNDYAFIPLEDGAIDPDFLKGVSEGTISPIKTVVRAYIGDEPVNSLQIGIEGEHIVVEGSTVFLNLAEIDSSITEIPLKITVGDRTYDKSWKLFYATTGYTISADSIVLKRGNMDGKLLDDILNVSITKWDGQKFINTGTPLFAKVYFDNGSEVQILSVEDGEISESDGGRAVIDLTKISNYPTKLHLYVVEPDADGNYRSDANEIAFQDVGVVFDGKNTFTINLTNDLGIIPLEEDGTIDVQAPDVTTTIQMYESEELVPATYSVNINSNAISVNDVGNVVVKPALFENVENVPKEIICSATYRGITLTRIFKLNVTKNAYELFTDSNILPRDPYSGVLIDSDIKCELRRWNSVDNVYELPSNITDLYVHAECRHLDDEPCPDSSKNVANNARFNENGFATVDLRDEVNLIYFRLYVSAESTLEAAKNNWLTYEDVAVTADGSSSLHLELTNDFTMVPTDDQGNVDTNWDEEDDENQDLAISTAILYLGSTQIEGTYSWEIIDGTGTLEDANTNTCSLITMSTDSITIRCTATCEVGSVSKDFNVVKSKGQPVYKLVPSANLFVYGKDNGGLIGPSKITFNVSKWTGFEYETVGNLSSEGIKITNSKNESISEVLPFRGDQEIYLKKSDNTLLDQETIGFVEGGSKGTDALHLELSNDFTMIATDDKGVPDVNWDEESDEGQDLAYSEAKLYVGTVEASNADYSWEIISGEGTLEDADTDKCSLVTLTTDSATIRCTATYEGTSIWKDFNVIKSKGQPVYKLVSSANLFTYGKDGSNTATPSKITFSVSKWTGSQYETVSDLSTEGLTLTNASGTSITEISPSKNNVTVYLKKGDVIIDQETIGYVEGGSKGSDALHLELSNDFTMVPTDSNGNVDISWDEESDAGQDLAISTASLYLGVNKIDSSKVTWNWTVVEGTSAGTLEDTTTDTCSVLTMNQDAITVRCTATYNGSSISKDLNVVKSKGQAVYKLVPSASVFAYNKAGVPNPSNITIKILKWDNGSYSEVNAVTEGLTLSHTVLTAQKASQTVTLKKGSVILDQETIGYIESGVDGLNANASFKSTVFIRSNSDLSNSAPEGGDYNSPKPTTTGWSDSIPSGSAILWASSRVFSSDGKYPQETTWSKPVQMTDTASFESVFGIKTAKVADLPTTNGLANPGTYINGWDDEPVDGVEYWYMATATNKNGVWSKWTVTKIKGEDGDDGHSIVMHETEPTNPEMGDGYVNDAGELLIWDGDSWVDCGKIKGENGTSNFIHVKYASEVTTNAEGYGVTGTFTASNGETPGKYMGVYVDDNEDDVLDITKYKWTKAEGEDGFGYEYIYRRTNSNEAPDVPTEKTADDIAPTNWTDAPTGIAENAMYEWVCWRKKIDGEWSDWVGSATNPFKAALWAKWGEKGKDGVITDAEKGRIEQDVRDAVLTTTQNNLNAAKTELSGKITEANTALETAKTNLQTAIEDEKKARASGDTAAAEAAANALKEAQKATANAAAYVKRLETVEGSITNLDSKIDTETGKIRDSVLTEEQVYELSIAALGSKAEVPEGSIAADSVFGQYFAGVVGVFGNLIADQVTATKISGALKGSDLQQLSIYSGTKYDDSAWALEKSGAGKIANGQISWNADGSEVKLGSNVTISWNSVKDHDNIENRIVSTAQDGMLKPEALENLDIDDKIKTYVTTNNKFVSKTIKSSLLDELSTADLTTKLGDTYITTDTVIANEMIASDISGKNISGSTFTCDNENDRGAKGKIVIQDGAGISLVDNDYWWFNIGASCASSGIQIGDSTTAPVCPKAAIYIHSIKNVTEWDYAIRTEDAIQTDAHINAADGFFRTSDERLKTFGDDLEIDFDKLKRIPKKHFTWNKNGKKDIGTSAQKIESIYPELVNRDDEFLSVDYSKFSIIALAAIDKLHEENLELRKELDDLKKYVYGNNIGK